jgi:hypothetical protein
MDYFITYLKFMRDYYILTESLVLDTGEENMKIASLATAVAEYEKFKNCIYNYYVISEQGVTIARKGNTSEEETLKLYNTEKEFHWNSF